jgi:hypothetical protein
MSFGLLLSPKVTIERGLWMGKAFGSLSGGVVVYLFLGFAAPLARLYDISRLELWAMGNELSRLGIGGDENHHVG